MQGSIWIQLGYMHDQKYVEGPYGGFDLKGQSSNFQNAPIELRLVRNDPYDLLSMLKILIN